MLFDYWPIISLRESFLSCFVSQSQWWVCAGLETPISQSRDNSEVDMKTISTFQQLRDVHSPCFWKLKKKKKSAFLNNWRQSVMYFQSSHFFLKSLDTSCSTVAVLCVVPLAWWEHKASLAQSPLSSHQRTDLGGYVLGPPGLFVVGHLWCSIVLAGWCENKSSAGMENNMAGRSTVQGGAHRQESFPAFNGEYLSLRSRSFLWEMWSSVLYHHITSTMLL